ncbi:predicted protein [Scheffersomyces stipitis CBS 6054]|uniref:Uncharacterized protein n=1 Tax=Scheffersomyces stipitis (strain ATCC 58785 / CBS 6054 / NBRC 10063 / NRRL Y-11545) TaxID=322104 RepID=A3LQM5_PICST|nr:predicted protein [Scheffersomyces stipitis CBS 6054]ABN65228.2 predicted protein [Scheffersomyces stipitis CBS 6054]
MVVDLYSVVHDIRYNWNYLAICYRQRYYSTNKNPRVIQTKLKNQTLISLRTFPQCKYLIKPGEFLALDSKNKVGREKYDVVENERDNQNNDINHYFVGFDDTFVERERKEMISRLVGTKRPSSAPDLVSLKRVVLGSSSCNCLCHDHPVNGDTKECEEAEEANLSKSSGVKDFFKGIIGYKKNEEGQLQGSSKVSAANSSICESIEKEQVPDIQPPFPVPKTRLFLNNLGSSSSLNSHGKDAEEKKIWQTVLNEVSLSAARISTGNKYTEIKNKISSPDFVVAKSQPKIGITNNENCCEISKADSADIFAEHLERAKAKYSEHFKLGPQSLSLNEIHRIDSREQVSAGSFCDHSELLGLYQYDTLCK